jgi:hypothetical protein
VGCRFQIFFIPIVVILILCVQIDKSALANKEQPTAFIHANLIPMTTETVLPDQTVVVEGKQIAALGPSSQTEIPSNAIVIDCQNAFLMPGLSDMHMHIGYDWNRKVWPVSPLKLYLANGVTTIRCFGPEGKTGRYVLTWRKEIDAGRLVGPNILTCGPQLRGHFEKNPEEIVIQQKYQGFDFIKIYSYVTKEEYYTIMATAKKLDIYTVGHIPFQVGLGGVLAEGMDEIAHVEELLYEFYNLDRSRYFEKEGEWMAWANHSGFYQLESYFNLDPKDRDQKLDDLVAPVVNKLTGKDVSICTTLVVDDVIVQKLFDPDLFLKKPETRFLPDWYRERFLSGKEKHQLQFKGGEVFAQFKYAMDKKLLSCLKKAGVQLLLSTDSGSGGMGVVPGFSIHDELSILVENGFTTYEALAAGTAVASKIVKRMNGRDDFGTIVPGKRADLIVLQQNPLEDVANTRKISGVMVAGRWYDQKAIAEMLDQ